MQVLLKGRKGVGKSSRFLIYMITGIVVAVKVLLNGCNRIGKALCNGIYLGLDIIVLQLDIRIVLSIRQCLIHRCCNTFKAYCVGAYLQELDRVFLLITFYTESVVLQLKALPCVVHIYQVLHSHIYGSNRLSCEYQLQIRIPDDDTGINSLILLCGSYKLYALKELILKDIDRSAQRITQMVLQLISSCKALLGSSKLYYM